MTMIWKNSFLKIEGNLSGIKFNNFYFIQIVLRCDQLKNKSSRCYFLNDRFVDLYPQCV
ncbi:unnamed protein product [Tenebrio molitor]|nr:unnamed protein product [Tenebrio molitor]